MVARGLAMLAKCGPNEMTMRGVYGLVVAEVVVRVLTFTHRRCPRRLS